MENQTKKINEIWWLTEEGWEHPERFGEIKVDEAKKSSNEILIDKIREYIKDKDKVTTREIVKEVMGFTDCDGNNFLPEKKKIAMILTNEFDWIRWRIAPETTYCYIPRSRYDKIRKYRKNSRNPVDTKFKLDDRKRKLLQQQSKS